MAQLGQQFDASAVPPSDRNFDNIPSGNYEAQIVESEVVPTKAGTGKMLKLTWEIITGQFANRKVFQQINIENQSAQAQAIGQRQLADICEAAGTGVIRDSEELHFKPVLVRVGVDKPNEGYEPKNEIKRVKSLSAQGAPAAGAGRAAASPPRSSPGTSQAPPPQQRPAAAGSRPWNR